MAAAHVFHICQNHPFVDGNKRAALASALVFLDMNGKYIIHETGRLFDAMMYLATGQLSKSEFEDILRSM
jgi:death-on-curing protein